MIRPEGFLRGLMPGSGFLRRFPASTQCFIECDEVGGGRGLELGEGGLLVGELAFGVEQLGEARVAELVALAQDLGAPPRACEGFLLSGE